MDRFAPQQRTNYVSLLNEWAIGFYTELDFLNEAANQQTLKVTCLAMIPPSSPTINYSSIGDVYKIIAIISRI